MRVLDVNFTAELDSADDSQFSRQPKHVVTVETETAQSAPGVVVEGLVFIQGEGIEWDLAPATSIYPNTFERIDAISQNVDTRSFSSSVGRFTVKLVDVDAAVIGHLSQILNDPTLRFARVSVFLGFEGFTDQLQFQLLMTAELQNIEVDGASVTLSCVDVTNRARRTIFRVGRTRLRRIPGEPGVSATATEIPAEGELSDFETVRHFAGFTDAPGETVGYFRIEDEIVRFTGIDVQGGLGTFTGCTRGVFDTKAEAYDVDPNNNQEPPAIEEFVYLEGNVVHIIRALLTGVFQDDVEGVVILPDRWHAGLNFNGDLQLSEWAAPNLQPDLFLEGQPFRSRIVRIWGGIADVQAKSFIESELLPVANVVLMPRANGRLGIRELGAVIDDAPNAMSFNNDVDDNITRVGKLRVSVADVRNVFRIQWNANSDGDVTRQNVFIDADSITEWGENDELRVRLPVLFGNRSTVSTITAVKEALRDRYSQPLIRLSIDVNSDGLAVEPLDTIRVRTQAIRDVAAEGQGTPPQARAVTIDRAFEVAAVRLDTQRLRARLDLVGQLRAPVPFADFPDIFALQDNFYDPNPPDIVDLATIPGISIDADGVLTGTGTITSPAGNISGGATFLGDLTIAEGAELIFSGSARLQVRGFLTVNGKLSALAEHTANADTISGFLANPAINERIPFESPPAAKPGYIGVVRAGDGFAQTSGLALAAEPRNGIVLRAPTNGAGRTNAPHVPLENRINDDGDNVLTPDDLVLEGTSGAPGARFYRSTPDPNGNGFSDFGYEVFAGGAGGAGTSGMLIICRGMTLGPDAVVELIGSDGADASTSPNAGGGAGGCPGACLVWLDGAIAAVPNFRPDGVEAFVGTENFIARKGRSGLGSARPRGNNARVRQGEFDLVDENGNLVLDADGNVITVNEYNASASSFRVQFIPPPQFPTVDRPNVPVSNFFETRDLPGTFPPGSLASFRDAPFVDIIHISRTGRIGIEIEFLSSESEADLAAAGINPAAWIRIERSDSFAIPLGESPFVQQLPLPFPLRNGLFSYGVAGWSRERVDGVFRESFKVSFQDRYGIGDFLLGFGGGPEGFPGPGPYLYRIFVFRTRIGAAGSSITNLEPTEPFNDGVGDEQIAFPAGGYLSVRTIELESGT